MGNGYLVQFRSLVGYGLCVGCVFSPVISSAMSIRVFWVGNHLLRMVSLGFWPHPVTHILVNVE